MFSSTERRQTSERLKERMKPSPRLQQAGQNRRIGHLRFAGITFSGSAGIKFDLRI